MKVKSCAEGGFVQELQPEPRVLSEDPGEQVRLSLTCQKSLPSWDEQMLEDGEKDSVPSRLDTGRTEILQVLGAGSEPQRKGHCGD